MKINLSKLLQFIQLVQDCPLEFPNRIRIILKSYDECSETSDFIVSVKVSPDLERVPERNIESEDSNRRNKILKDLINQYSRPFKFPDKPASVFLLPAASRCPECEGVLKIVRPSLLGRAAIVYTKEGPRVATVYHKSCSACQITVYYCYHEKKNDTGSYRTYYNRLEFFSVTQAGLI